MGFEVNNIDIASCMRHIKGKNSYKLNTNVQCFCMSSRFKIGFKVDKNKIWDPLRAMKTFIRMKMGHAT